MSSFSLTSFRSRTARTTAALMVGAFAVAACSDGPTAVKSAGARPAMAVNGIAEKGEFEVCVSGTAATFSVTSTALGGAPTVAPSTATIASGCQIVFSSNAGSGMGYTVVVTQTSPSTTPTSVVCTPSDLGTPATCGGSTASGFVNQFHGVVATFTNAAPPPPPPPPATGCTYTQGWYKNKGVGSLPGGMFAMSGQSYLDVLNTAPKGGNEYYILAHQYIAASLNAKSIGGAPAAVTTALNAAATYFAIATPSNPVPKGFTSAQIIGWSDLLDSFNNGNFKSYPHCD